MTSALYALIYIFLKAMNPSTPCSDSPETKLSGFMLGLVCVNCESPPA